MQCDVPQLKIWHKSKQVADTSHRKPDTYYKMLNIPLSETAGITKDILGLVVLLCAVAGNSK